MRRDIHCQEASRQPLQCTSPIEILAVNICNMREKKKWWNTIVIQIWRSNQSDYKPQGVVEARCWQWFPWVILFQIHTRKWRNFIVIEIQLCGIFYLLCIIKQLDDRFWAKLVNYWLWFCYPLHLWPYDYAHQP